MGARGVQGAPVPHLPPHKDSRLSVPRALAIPRPWLRLRGRTVRGAQILLQVVNGALCRRTLHEFGFRAFRIVGTDAFLLARPVARTPMMPHNRLIILTL